MTDTDAGIPIVPAPWTLTGVTSWTFLCSPLNPQVSLPRGWAAPNEADALSDGTFVGGPSGIMVVRYGASPAGPYDELIYIPGRWKDANGKTGFRISRIYVSTLVSVENGRKNWNIPKHLANFDFVQEGKQTRLSVKLPESTEPFFDALFSPLPTLFALPASTSILGQYMQVIQPPLPASPDERGVIATTSHTAITPILKGSVKLASLKGNMSDGMLANGIDFPAVVPWRFGFQMLDGTTEFGLPEVYSP
ncbi:hypothetical protein FRB95_003885 [Tulasnella sp. JGI-2019a]|nr:hypothetical protein FRB95_003885 [Tulasnella sp. JGI-2019a]